MSLNRLTQLVDLSMHDFTSFIDLSLFHLTSLTDMAFLSAFCRYSESSWSDGETFKDLTS